MKLVLTTLVLAVAQAQTICTSDNNIFNVKVNIYSGELGYYTFDECGDDVSNPTLGLEIGQTYTFIQSDISNYYHPIGFAYFPDGAHADLDELEPSIAQGTDTSCADDLSCPAPMYVVDNDYPTDYYSNIVETDFPAPTSNVENFGLDDYEPLFFLPLGDWLGRSFEVKLNFDDASFTDDFFYFCHIHQFMSARIKLLNGGVPINTVDSPPLGYIYDYEIMNDSESEEDSMSGDTAASSPCLSGVVTVRGRESNVNVRSLKKGFEILTEDSGEFQTYEEVYSFGHYNEYSTSSFIVLETEEKSDVLLEISAEHLLYKSSENGQPATPVRADYLKVGDFLVGSTGKKEVVKDMYMINRQGVYSPLVSDGYFLASGTKVSSYTAATSEDPQFVKVGDFNLISHHTLSHVGITPFRFLCKGENELCNERNAEGQLLFAKMGSDIALYGHALLMLLITVCILPLFILEQLSLGLGVNFVAMVIGLCVLLGMHLTQRIKK